MVWGLGFGVWVLGFGVWGMGLGVWGLGFWVWGLGFRVQASGFWVQAEGFGFKNRPTPAPTPVWGAYLWPDRAVGNEFDDLVLPW